MIRVEPDEGVATKVQYEMLAGSPGRWTQEDVLLASSPQVRGKELDLDQGELERLRTEFFAVPRACLRARR